eukprot:SAG11_NODE_17175_length_526_cov_0.838407_1_plen_105_part_10
MPSLFSRLLSWAEAGVPEWAISALDGGIDRGEKRGSFSSEELNPLADSEPDSESKPPLGGEDDLLDHALSLATGLFPDPNEIDRLDFEERQSSLQASKEFEASSK